MPSKEEKEEEEEEQKEEEEDEEDGATVGKGDSTSTVHFCCWSSDKVHGLMVQTTWI